ncbi:MOS1T transposase, partial [Pseudoatta argentina]
RKTEQRINVKFLVKLKKTPIECYKFLKEAYGENSLSRARVFEWYKRFSEGLESTEDDQRPGRPVSVSTPQTVTKINSWILHQDNAPPHNALSVKRYLAARSTPVLEYAPYSPDLAPCDFFLFPKIKSALKGIRFESMEEVKRKSAELQMLLQNKTSSIALTNEKNEWNGVWRGEGSTLKGSIRL